MQQFDVVICGAGMAGISTAYSLAVKHGVTNVLLVDERPPLTLTSDKSTEAYRNWWPDAPMVQLVNRSIDIIEQLADESDNRFLMNRRGYTYVTANPKQVDVLRQNGKRAEAAGAGPLRLIDGSANAPAYRPIDPFAYKGQPAGADLLTDQKLINQHFPFLSDDVVGILHARRCGWLSAQQLGMYMLEQCMAAGVQLMEGKVVAVDTAGDRVRSVTVQTAGREEIVGTGRFANCAGPLAPGVGKLLNVELPLISERHLKVAFKDHLGIIPRDAPFMIWDDPQTLSWTDDEREMLSESDDTAFMLKEMPNGTHFRPEGHGDSQWIIALWEYHTDPVDVIFPVPDDPYFPELVMRGLSRMIPNVATYIERMPQIFIDGGYYTKTPENKLLCCPTGPEGAYTLAGLSGFGIMSGCGAGDLLADQLLGNSLPSYASAFDIRRYEDEAYRTWAEGQRLRGQLSN